MSLITNILISNFSFLSLHFKLNVCKSFTCRNPSKKSSLCTMLVTYDNKAHRHRNLLIYTVKASDNQLGVNRILCRHKMNTCYETCHLPTLSNSFWLESIKLIAMLSLHKGLTILNIIAWMCAQLIPIMYILALVPHRSY